MARKDGKPGRLAQIGGGPVLRQLMLFALTLASMWSLFCAQRAANAAEGDPSGTSNASLTAANIVWIVLGGMLWSTMLFGMYVLLQRSFD